MVYIRGMFIVNPNNNKVMMVAREGNSLCEINVNDEQLAVSA